MNIALIAKLVAWLETAKCKIKKLKCKSADVMPFLTSRFAIQDSNFLTVAAALLLQNSHQ
jgi:hypothetical protein